MSMQTPVFEGATAEGPVDGTVDDMDRPLLVMRGIEKSFFGVRVLREVDFAVRAGEVHALVGENGAGKSTLVKILNGDYQRDGGAILLDGSEVQLNSPREAEEHGIRMIYQELTYAPDLSVTENLLLGHLPLKRGLLGIRGVDWRAAERATVELLDQLGIDLNPQERMGNLSAVERQVVQIAKAFSAQARVLVMDEPTAALTPHEVNALFSFTDRLRAQGVAIVYISHRLDEILRIAQRVTVLRDGAVVGTRHARELTKAEMVRMMVGRDIGEGWSRSPSKQASPGTKAPLLEVRGLTHRRAFHDVSFQVGTGEIVGIFGLLGAGHVPLSRAIFGAERLEHGAVIVDGAPVRVRTPREGLRQRIGLVPADRKIEGIVLERSVKENITLSNWRNLSSGGFFHRRAERAHTSAWIDRLGIRMAGSMDTPIRYLSGGNQQKALLARWLEAGVRVLILNEPTHGVDIGARFDIYQLLEELAAGGLAILLVSSDIQEVLAVSHRILTFHGGVISGEFLQADADQATLLHAASGLTTSEAQGV